MSKSKMSIGKLFREYVEEISPTVAANERLLKAAEDHHRNWFSLFFGETLPRNVLKPKVGVAMIAILLVSAIYFYYSAKDLVDLHKYLHHLTPPQ